MSLAMPSVTPLPPKSGSEASAGGEFERFITTLESLPDEVTDFSEDLWGSLVEYLTVYAKDDLRFMLPCEVEIEA